MRCYFAPLEGLTDSIYRRLHHQYFGGVDAYFTPFFSPTVHRLLTPREERELPMADIPGFPVTPQLLTKNAEDFLWMAEQCAGRGYAQVNLNLGCPSGTVVSKGKGSGMLSAPDTLDAFLEQIFSRSVLPVSVKTRVGVKEEEELPRLMEIFNRYPIRELIVHPRLRRDYYDAPVRWMCFDYVMQNAKAKVCFNGNLCSVGQLSAFSERYPQVGSVMIGRGLIGDPGMLAPGGSDAKTLEAFHNALLEEYLVAFGGSRNAMFRLKENWRYLLCRFENSEKLGKRLRKTTDLAEYRSITAEIFHTLPLKSELTPDW